MMQVSHHQLMNLLQTIQIRTAFGNVPLKQPSGLSPRQQLTTATASGNFASDYLKNTATDALFISAHKPVIEPIFTFLFLYHNSSPIDGSQIPKIINTVLIISRYHCWYICLKY